MKWNCNSGASLPVIDMIMVILAMASSISSIDAFAFVPSLQNQQLLQVQQRSHQAWKLNQISAHPAYPAHPSRWQSQSKSQRSTSQSQLSSTNTDVSHNGLDDAFCRDEYQKWCTMYRKVPDENRFAIWKQNFERQVHHDTNANANVGVTHTSLNEYGDMTYDQYMLAETHLQHAYQQWRQEHQKDDDYDDSSRVSVAERYEIFKNNYVQNWKHYQQTGDYYHLNAYADWTEEEFRAKHGMGSDEAPKVLDPAGPPLETASAAGAGMASFADSLEGTGLPSYFDGMVQPVSDSPLTPAGPTSTSTMKPSTFMPTSYKPSSGSGMPSYFDNMSTATSASEPPAYDYPSPTPVTDPSLAIQNEMYRGGPPAREGTSSFTDSLSGNSNYNNNNQESNNVKTSNFMPTSYQPTSGSGMPSYFDTMSSGTSTSTSDTSSNGYEPPANQYPPPTPAFGQPATHSQPLPTQEGGGVTSFADTLSGSTSSVPSPNSSFNYMPQKSNFERDASTGGSGMPSYFDSMPASFESPAFPASATPTYESQSPPLPQALPPPPPPMPPVTPQSQAPADTGAGMSSYVVPADQQAELLRFPNPQVNGPAQPLAHSLQNPQSARSDQSADLLRHPNPQVGGPSQPLARHLQNPQVAPSDQSSNLLRQHNPPHLEQASQPFHSLSDPQLLKSDQTTIMREGLGFLPHKMDPVIRRGNVMEPDQSGFFFTGRSDSSYNRHAGNVFESDQQKAETFHRERLRYFQDGAHLGRGPPTPPTRGYQPQGVVRAGTLGSQSSSRSRRSLPAGPPQSYMPTSYRESAGSGMPSYFDSFSSS